PASLRHYNVERAVRETYDAHFNRIISCLRWRVGTAIQSSIHKPDTKGFIRTVGQRTEIEGPFDRDSVVDLEAGSEVASIDAGRNNQGIDDERCVGTGAYGAGGT